MSACLPQYNAYECVVSTCLVSVRMLVDCSIGVVIWDAAAHKPVHLGYWPDSLAAARISDK